MRIEKKSPLKILQAMCLAIVDRSDESLARLKDEDKRKCVAAALKLYGLPKRMKGMSASRCLTIVADPKSVCRFRWILAEDPRMTRALDMLERSGMNADIHCDYFLEARDILEIFGEILLRAVATIVHHRILLKRQSRSLKTPRIKELAEQLIYAEFVRAVEHVCSWIFVRGRLCGGVTSHIPDRLAH